MAVSKGGRTLQAQLIEKLQDDPKALWTRDDVMEYLGVEDRAAENALYNAWRTEKICRHVERCPKTNLYQYALTITPAKSAPYEMVPRSPTGKKKKGQLPTAKEVRTMFAQAQNQMAKLEDMVIAIVDEYEETEKLLNKIKNITS